jgi:hypothetical protein
MPLPTSKLKMLVMLTTMIMTLPSKVILVVMLLSRIRQMSGLILDRYTAD